MFPVREAAPFTVTQFNVVVPSDHSQPETSTVDNVALQLEEIFLTVTSPVKSDGQVTDNVPVDVVVETTSVIFPVVAVMSVEVNDVMFQVSAVSPAVVVSQVTDKFQPTETSASVLISQSNIVSQVTSKLSSVALPEVSSVAVLTSVAETFVVFTSVAFTVVMFPVVAVTVVPVNSHSAVMLPVNVTLPSTVWSVTLSNSKLS